MTICTKCKINKSNECFSPDRLKKNGLKSHCKDCRNLFLREYRTNKRGDREWVKKTNNDLRIFLKNNPDKKEKYYKTKTKEQHLKYSLKSNYNITLDYYNELLNNQNNVCAICGNYDIYYKNGEQLFRRLAVDHNHETGNVRGLLCSACNGGLGLFKDNINNLKIAINYLTKEA